MVKLETIINDVIFIAFRDIDRLKEIGITENSGHFLLKGYDQLGLWLEHPGIIIHHMEDNKGRPMPPDKHDKEEIDAIFMVQWNNISTLMHYPNRKGFDFPADLKMKIGFKVKRNTNE